MHEPNEIETQMKSYIPVIHSHVRIEIGAFDADEKIRHRYAKGEFTELIDAITYAEKHEPEFDPFPILEKTFSEYRPPSDIEELLLKAEIAGDQKWADFWRKYMTA